MEALEQLQHWAVIVFEKVRRHPHAAVGCDPDEMLIESAMVDRAKAEAVVHGRFTARLHISDDVRRVEQRYLLETTDRTLVAIRRQHSPPEATLMHADPHVAIDVASLERIVDDDRFRLVEVTAHLPLLDEHRTAGRIVVRDEARKDRLVCSRSRGDEIHDWHAERACLPQRAIVR